MGVDTYTSYTTQTTYTSNDTWVCPSGVTEIDVECWGGGASGGGFGLSQAGGGGGAGAYVKKFRYSVTPGNSYTINVGTGGATVTGNSFGNDGNDTYFDNSSAILAKAGKAGITAIQNGGIGGLQSSSIGDVKLPGGNGGTTQSFASNGSGGGASTSYNYTLGTAGTSAIAPTNGGAGQTAGTTGAAGGTPPSGGGTGGNGGGTSTSAIAGSDTGAGGGGASAAHTTSGAGAAGKIIVSYYGPWTCPLGVTAVNAEVWAGGGAGDGADINNRGGGGGAGGAYSKQTAISVTPGTAYSIYVGSGGFTMNSNGNAHNASLTQPGQDSWFVNVSTCLAKGGGAGTSAIGAAGGTGGASGSGVGGTKFSGGNGAAGATNDPKGSSRSGGGGSSAGTAANGNAASTFHAGSAVTGGGAGGNGYDFLSSTGGSAGSNPGGGGGGGNVEHTSGFRGGSGKVILTSNAAFDVKPFIPIYRNRKRRYGNLLLSLKAKDTIAFLDTTAYQGILNFSPTDAINFVSSIPIRIVDRHPNKKRFIFVRKHVSELITDSIAFTDQALPQIIVTISTIDSIIFGSSIPVRITDKRKERRKFLYTKYPHKVIDALSFNDGVIYQSIFNLSATDSIAFVSSIPIRITDKRKNKRLFLYYFKRPHVTDIIAFTEHVALNLIFNRSFTDTISFGTLESHFNYFTADTLTFSDSHTKQELLNRTITQTISFNEIIHPAYINTTHIGLFTLQAPASSIQVTTVLPSPLWGDSYNNKSESRLKRSMNNVVYTYPRNSSTLHLSYKFRLTQSKALELIAFIETFYGTRIKITDHNNSMWLGFITNSPPSLSVVERDEVQEISLEFDVVPYA